MGASSWSGLGASCETLLHSRSRQPGLNADAGLSFAPEPRRRVARSYDSRNLAGASLDATGASIVRHKLSLPRLSPLSGFAEGKLPAAEALSGCRFLFALDLSFLSELGGTLGGGFLFNSVFSFKFIRYAINTNTMTSANVVNYTIQDSTGKTVGEHRQHLLCKSIKSELLQYVPSNAFKITVSGLDEYEAPWENEPMSLEQFLK